MIKNSLTFSGTLCVLVCLLVCLFVLSFLCRPPIAYREFNSVLLHYGWLILNLRMPICGRLLRQMSPKRIMRKNRHAKETLEDSQAVPYLPYVETLSGRPSHRRQQAELPLSRTQVLCSSPHQMSAPDCPLPEKKPLPNSHTLQIQNNATSPY